MRDNLTVKIPTWVILIIMGNKGWLWAWRRELDSDWLLLDNGVPIVVKKKATHLRRMTM